MTITTTIFTRRKLHLIDLDNLTRSQKALLNAMIVGGISFFSVMVANPGLPTLENVYVAFISSALACLIRIQDFIDSGSKDNGEKKTLKNKKTDENCVNKECPSKLKLGMLI